MKKIHVSQFVSKALACLLCFILLAPIAAAAPPAGQPGQQAQQAQQSQQTAQAQDDSNRKAPQPLTEEERNQLAKQSEEPGKEVAGGALSNQMLTYVVIAIAAAVIVLIAK